MARKTKRTEEDNGGVAAALAVWGGVGWGWGASIAFIAVIAIVSAIAIIATIATIATIAIISVSAIIGPSRQHRY